MTQLADFSFVINRSLGTIHLNSVGASLTTNTLAANVSFVQYDSDVGTGRITYNDRPALPELFTDPSPYQTYINQWITAAASFSPALTLAQARAVKNGLIDSIWAGKRQAPISVVTSLGTYNFDANDILSGALNIGAWMPAVASLIAQGTVPQFAAINTAITNMLTTINAAIAALTNSVNVDIVGGAGLEVQINTALSRICSEGNQDFTDIITQLNTLTGGGYTPVPQTLDYTTVSVSAVTGGSGAYTPPSALTALPTLTAPVKMLPVGSTSYPAFTLADQFAVLTAIQTQRANELAVRATKQAAVAALATVANVIAYDTTTGW